MELDMQCDVCHKREATIHITEVVNDEAKELHVCQHCAEAQSIKMQQSFGIADLLSGLVDFPGIIKDDEEALRCANCGMAYSDFRKIGRFGCSQCYTAFRRVLTPLLKNIHGSVRHIGKEPDAKMIPKRLQQQKEIKVITKEQELSELKKKLQRAILAEEYEEAAILRDKIRPLEKQKD